MACSERAGFVERHAAHRVRDFQRFRVLDQDAVARGDAGADHDRCRRCQAQRAGAGNDQHRDRVQQRLLPVAAGESPAQQGHQRDDQHHRHKHLAHLIHQTLDRCFGSLRVFHHADDARQRGFRTHRQGFHQQQTVAIHRTAGDMRIRALAERQALAGDERFVHLAVAFAHRAIHSDALAGAHHDQVADAHGGQRDFDIHAITAHPRGIRAQRLQRADGSGGFALGAGFQPLAQQHQRDDYGGCLEIQVRHGVGGMRQQQINRQSIRRRRPQRHQQIHVAGASLDRLPARAVETPAEPELHRCRQRPLHPAGQSPVLPE